MKNTIKKAVLITLTISTFLIFFNDNVLANELNEEEIVTKTSEDTTRPRKIWITTKKYFSGNPPTTVQHQVNAHGAIYKGTLSLRYDKDSSNWHEYYGYVYNTNNNYIPLREEALK